MSKKDKKMLNAAINTDSMIFDDNVKSLKLKQRNVKHIRLSQSLDLHDMYNFGEQIGQGSFGTVISIVDKTTEKKWAMKVVNKTAASDKMQTVKREIFILKMVEHPHIIYMDKVFETNKKIYMVLERCYGELSKVYSEKKPFSEMDTKKIIGDLTSAVCYLHKNDIVHRDLKLENILIAKNPEDIKDKLYIKVSDFGLSIVKSGSGYEDMLHECCGTLTYMAPEIITSHSYSQQCDVWAIGVIMFMLLGGHSPFYSSNEHELMDLICKGQVSYTDMSASPESLQLLTKMLTKNPALRITAAEVVLHPWFTGKTVTNESENVLDMMHKWRSEMMLPVGDECDWVSSARACGSSTVVECDATTKLPAAHPGKAPVERENAESAAAANARKQSMHLPVKNICFQRAPPVAGRESTAGSSNRKGNSPPPTTEQAARRKVEKPRNKIGD